jgi:thiamine kinase-like enzyme
MQEDDIAAIAAGIAVLSGFTGRAERLGGLTNRVYRLGEHILRVPGSGTEEYIDRAREAAMADAAAQAGVAPRLIWADPARGLMVTEFVEGVTLTPALFASRPGAPGRAAQALGRLHRSGAEFPFRFELFAMIDDYLRLLAGKEVELPAGYHDVVAEAGAVRAALAARPVAPVDCHCDPLCENFIDDGTRVRIVDWEYAGMNDPMWDLGDLSVEAQFGPGQEEEMLTAYFGAEARPADRGRMVIYKAMCDLLWTLWGLIQLANANPADDFAAYAAGRFARCRALMGTPDFARHLAAVARG